MGIDDDDTLIVYDTGAENVSALQPATLASNTTRFTPSTSSVTVLKVQAPTACSALL